MQATRRSFFTGLLAASGAAFAARVRAGVSARHDPNLAVFISDLHLNGLTGEVQTFRDAIGREKNGQTCTFRLA